MANACRRHDKCVGMRCSNANAQMGADADRFATGFYSRADFHSCISSKHFIFVFFIFSVHYIAVVHHAFTRQICWSGDKILDNTLSVCMCVLTAQPNLSTTYIRRGSQINNIRRRKNIPHQFRYDTEIERKNSGYFKIWCISTQKCWLAIVLPHPHSISQLSSLQSPDLIQKKTAAFSVLCKSLFYPTHIQMHFGIDPNTERIRLRYTDVRCV